MIQSGRKTTRQSGDRLRDSNNGAVGACAADHSAIDRPTLALLSAPNINVTGLRGVAQRRSTLNQSTTLIALIMGIFVMHTLSAEPAPADNIIISAYRTPASPLNVGSAVSTVDRQLIEDRQSVFATALLRDLPGIAVSRSGNFGAQTAIRIRGAEANQVLVRIDGIEVNDPATDDAFAFGHLTTNDIQQIEVVRGPQSAVWGSDALAGVIDISTRRSTDRFSSDAFLETGSFNTVNGGLHVGTRGANSGVDLTASYLNSDGTNISRSGSEDDGYDNLTANLRGDIDITQNFRFDGSLRYVDSTKQFDAIDFSTGLPADADRESDSVQSTIGVGGTWALLENFWIQSLRLTGMDTNHKNYSDGIQDTRTGANKYAVYYQTTLEFNAGPSDESTQLLTLAVDYEQEEFEQRGTPSIFGDPNQNQDMNNTGLIGEYRATGFGNWSFSLGLRYDDNSAFDNITTYRTTAVYHFAKLESRLHASLGTGQKSPTFTERFGYTPDQFQGNPDLRPETSQGFDVGYEQYFLNARIVADVTYFRERLEDEINGFYFDPSLGAFGMFTAVNLEGTSKSKGVEVELSAQITDGLDIKASYTYTDANQPDAAGEQQREIRRPRNMAALNLNYAFFNRAQINANVSYTGEQTDVFFPPFPAPSETVSLDAYTLVDLTGSFAITNNVTVYGRIDNLFDVTYEDVYGFATPGVGGFLGARVKFSN